MGSTTRTDKAHAIRRLMDTEGPAVAQNTRGFNSGRYTSVARLDDYEGLKDRARAIKERAIDRLPELIDQVREQVEARGGHVYLAEDATDANRYIAEVVEGADRLVKSKSMTTEEIDVNEHLEALGVETVETDLGEWVLQVAKERPSHIVAPAIHKSREAIADLFNRQFNPPERLETAEELTQFAQEHLGRLIQDADVGMTGANFITADTGTLVLVTSEGNARKSALVPPTYIAVAGVEKILPCVEDLQPFVELIGRSGTGQDITSYVSLFTPPFDSPPIDFARPDESMDTGDRSFHLVLLDNGRMHMREDSQLKETLYCIRCGACANSCANFQQVGGHAFGGETYSGGIATGWEAGVHGLDAAASFNDLCTGCSRCVNACPVGIDIPWINTVVRDRINRDREDGGLDWLVDGLRPDTNGEGASLRQHVFARFEALAKIGSATAPLSNWVNRRQSTRFLLDWMLGIDRRRPLPAFSRQTLRGWFANRDGPDRPTGATAERVVLYPDVYTNYIHVERGKAAIRTLEALGATVEIPDVPGSGRAPLSQGMISSAEEKAQAVWEVLRRPVEAGREVLVIEPTDLAMFQRRYNRFLPDGAAEVLRDRTSEIMEYVARKVGEGIGGLRSGSGRSVAYHSHCQQRTMDLETATVALLSDLGYDVQTSSVECCGMAGSFGYKSEYYELSMEVGQELGDQFSQDGDRTVVASGTSCQEQLGVMLDQPVVHPIELIAPAE